MKPDPKKDDQKSKANQRAPSNLPATEIAKNPNPAANENINEETSSSISSNKNNKPGVGSEITDGEDG